MNDWVSDSYVEQMVPCRWMMREWFKKRMGEFIGIGTKNKFFGFHNKHTGIKRSQMVQVLTTKLPMAYSNLRYYPNSLVY